ncbi:MAG TPA: CehA/McbA family metallohydrolase, partial [Polyangiaceae bacterium]
GDRVEWPGRATFAPRLGLVTEPARAEVAWVAKEGSSVSYGLAFDQGPQEVEFLFDRVGPVGVLALSAGEPLAPGAQLVYRRSLIVSSGGLGEVAKAAFQIQGKRTGTVRGSVQPVPRRGVVVAQLPDGKPLVQVQTSAQGTFELALPAGRYTVASQTAGGVDHEDVEIVAGSTRKVALLAPLAGSLRYTIRDASGSPMPGRLTLRGVAPTRNPDFGEWERAEGVRNVVYSGSGEGVLELPAGKYRVIVTRGFEYSIFEKQIEVGATSGASVRAQLKHELDTPGWVAGDFHLHAAPSFDSTIPLTDRVISLSAEGVEFAVATDHNHVTDYAPALDETGLVDRLGATPGVEVTTERWGHFIAFPYAAGQPAPPFEGVDPGVIFDAIRAQSPNSIIQINHPRMAPIAYFASLKVDASLSAVGEVDAAEHEHSRAGARAAGGQTALDSRAGAAWLEPAPGFSFDFDTIEVVNGFELADEPVMERNLADWFALLNLGYRYTAVGNSDSHSLVHQWVGFPRTYVRVQTEDLARLEGIEVAHALLYGRAQISNGIFLEVRTEGGAEPGDELTLAGGRLDLKILARAAPWVSISHAEIWVNGVQRANSSLARALRAPNRLQWVTGLSIASDAWLVVIARGDKDLGERYPGAKGKPFAITNPLFLDVDGDGVFRAPLAASDPVAHPASGVFERPKQPR